MSDPKYFWLRKIKDNCEHLDLASLEQLNFFIAKHLVDARSFTAAIESYTNEVNGTGEDDA